VVQLFFNFYLQKFHSAVLSFGNEQSNDLECEPWADDHPRQVAGTNGAPSQLQLIVSIAIAGPLVAIALVAIDSQ
jgi:hypothetical protein